MIFPVGLVPVSSLLIIDTGPGFKNDEAREGWNKYAIKSAEKYENRNHINLLKFVGSDVFVFADILDTLFVNSSGGGE